MMIIITILKIKITMIKNIIENIKNSKIITK